MVENPDEFLKETMSEVQEETKKDSGWAGVIAKFEDGNSTKLEAIKEAANFILGNNHLITFEDSKRIWVFNNPTYKPKGEVKIEKELENHLQKYVRNNDVKEVVKSVKRKTYRERDEVEDRKRYIPVKNGWYDLKNDEIKDPSPEYFIRNEIPVEYNPEADCPKIKQFISEIVEDENVPVIQEMIGYCMYRGYPVSKAFMLLGAGKNGKSTLLNLIEIFLGKNNISGPALQRLLKNDFTKLNLKDKLANTHADLSPEKLRRTGTFKMLTGDDAISGEIKHVQGEIRFRNYAKLIYSANELPPTKDVTDAFFRRWIIINFPYKFTEEPNDGHKDKDSSLPGSILTDEELSGLFNWALKGLKRVLENEEFTTTDSMEKIKEKWLTRTNPLQVFIKKHTEFVADAEIPKSDFRDALNEFCEANDAKTYKLQTITKELQRRVPKFDTTRPEFEGKRVRCYKGILVTNEYKEHVQPVQGFEKYYNNNDGGGSYSLINKKRLDRLDIEPKKDEKENFSHLAIANGDDQREVVALVQKYKKENDEDLAYINQVTENCDLPQDEVWKIIEDLKNSKILYEPEHGMLGVLK